MLIIIRKESHIDHHLRSSLLIIMFINTIMNYIILAILFIITCLIIYYYYSKRTKDITTTNLNYIKKADDITKMNETSVANVFNVLSIEDVLHVINLAKNNNKKVIARGEMHSMGGHTIAKDGYVIDTHLMNHILDFDKKNNTVTVEPGILWCNLIYYLNLYGYSPEILQSYASFSIGGSISVNIHGITSDNTLSQSVIEIELIDHNADVIICNRNQNSELFFLVIGGYGLFGIITKVKLRIVENTGLSLTTKTINASNFHDIYHKLLSDEVGVKFARINILNMDDINLYLFTKTDTKIKSNIDTNPKEMSKISQLLYKWILPDENAQKVRYGLETKMGKPLDINSNQITRNELLYESAKSLSNLYSPLIDINKTHILQEYFIPNNNNNFVEFMTYLREIFVNNRDKLSGIDLLNITIRYVVKDNETFLNYAKKDMYAFVFYYRINCDKNGDSKLQYIHNLLVIKTLALSGTFYLPYRHHYDQQQLKFAYPNIDDFFALKKHYDPNEMFCNLWYLKYEPNSEKVILSNTNTVTKYKYNTTTYPTFYSNSYDYILSSEHWKDKLKLFLTYIFDLVPPDELYDYIYSTYSLNKNMSDLAIFLKIKEYIIENYSKFNIAYKSYSLVNRQQSLISNCIKELLLKIGVNYPLNNYVSFGDSGRYISILKDDLDITGDIYVVNDNYNYSEQSLVSIKSKFIQYDYDIMNKLEIKDNNIELITCLIGLHHFKPDKLKSFLKNIYDMLKPNGFFIIREHNADFDIIPLLTCAHSIFNAVTGETLQTEKNELRNFHPIRTWRQIIENAGFKDMRIYTLQENDPTENFFMCFIKPDTTNAFIPLNLKSQCHKNENYKRELCQSYLTAPEWYSVDIVKSYGDYLEHTPWYDYPYWSTIAEYWKLVFKGVVISTDKCGLGKTVSSWSYTFMNCIIGILLTIVFTQLGILSILPSMFYHLPQNVTPDTIRMIVYGDNIDFKTVNKKIKLINQEGSYYVVEVSRYKQFMKILLDMLLNNIEIMEISGQTEIQVRVKNINKVEGVEILYNYPENKSMIISVPVNKIIDLVKQNVVIEHIYDY
jgi:predicted SAM-dependent methyltransferase